MTTGLKYSRLGLIKVSTPMEAEAAGSADLTAIDTHFEFGANWQDYLRHIDPEAIASAERGLLRLVKIERLRGARFLDIGCGSGLSGLAALRLGVKELVAIDLDPDSVAAATTLLSDAPTGIPIDIRQMSVFDVTPETLGTFDVVYSWGVLHHTGSMWRAIDQAAALVKPAGTLAIALYQKRPTCALWTAEKRLYTRSGAEVRGWFRRAYKAVLFTGLLATGRSPMRYVREYRNRRGMHLDNDIHDWLGGYPYESATPAEVMSHMAARGFTLVSAKILKKAVGILGTGCAEYTFEKGVSTQDRTSAEGLTQAS